MPAFAGDDVRAAAALRLRPLVDLRRRLAEDARLDGLPLAVQLLEVVREPFRLVGVVGEEQLERGARVAEAARGVDARAEPEAARARVDGRRVDAGRAHQRLQARLLRAGERPQPRDRERAVLVEERHDVGDRREGDEVEVALRDLGVDAEERLAELVDDARAAELGERIVGRPRRDDRGSRAAPARAGDGR